MSRSETPAEGTEALAPDPWECHGFRVVPCMNADSVWVEVTPPSDAPIEMSPPIARELAEFLARVATTAEAWGGRSRRGRDPADGQSTGSVG